MANSTTNKGVNNMFDNATKISVKGEAIYPALNKPETRFDVNGVYKVTLKVAKSDASEMVKLFDQAIEDSLATAKLEQKGKLIKLAPKPYAIEGEDVFFKFKMKASGVTKKTQEKFTQRPMLFDAKRNPIPLDKRIAGGSEIKVAFQLRPYYSPALGAGIVSQLKAVQVIKLVEGAEADLFADEDGFTVNNENKGEQNSNEKTEAVQESFDF
jgi:hypothetical protein